MEGAPPSSESFSSTSNLLLQIRVFGAVDDVVLQVGGHVAEVRTVPGHTDDQVAIAVGVLLGGEQGVAVDDVELEMPQFQVAPRADDAQT